MRMRAQGGTALMLAIVTIMLIAIALYLAYRAVQ